MSSSFDQLFPRRIRDLRKKLGLTQIELAAKAEILQPRISKMESGDAQPTVIELDRLARALQVDVVDLMGVGGAAADSDATMRRLSQVVERLSPADRDMLMQIAEVILKRSKKG